MGKLFISYSRTDIDFARRLATDLEKAGHDVWWDITDLHGGDNWPQHLQTALDECDTCLVILTSNSVSSRWVRKEYTYALHKNKAIIPILYQTCDIPLPLYDLNYVDFTKEYGGGYSQLSIALLRTQKKNTRSSIQPEILTRGRTVFKVSLLGYLLILDKLSVSTFKKIRVGKYSITSLPLYVLAGILIRVLITALLGESLLLAFAPISVEIFFGFAFGPIVGTLTGLLGSLFSILLFESDLQQLLSFGNIWAITGAGIIGLLCGYIDNTELIASAWWRKINTRFQMVAIYAFGAIYSSVGYLYTPGEEVDLLEIGILGFGGMVCCFPLNLMGTIILVQTLIVLYGYTIKFLKA